MKKLLICMQLIAITLIIFNINVYAADSEMKNTNFLVNDSRENIESNQDGISTYSDTLHYYILKNKKYKSKKKYIVAYLTNAWAKAKEYTVSKTKSYTGTLSVEPISGTFTKSIIKSVGITASKTKSYSVGTTISANSSKYSKLIVQVEKYKYYADVYNVIDYGYSKSTSKKGSGYYYEPKDLYLIVKYK